MSEIVLEFVGGRASLHLGEATRELGLDLFGATLTLGSILVDLGELELHAVEHVVPTLDHGVVICSPDPIDRVLVELDLLDLGVDRRRQRSEGVEGILLCYGLVGPMASRMGKMADEEHAFLLVLRVIMIAFLKGVAPIMAVEIGRRTVPGHVRPGFKAVEEACRGARDEAKAAAGAPDEATPA